LFNGQYFKGGNYLKL